jgi:hypothetical protein
VSEMNEEIFLFWVQGLSDFGAGAHLLTFIGEAKASRWPAHMSKQPWFNGKQPFHASYQNALKSQDLFMTFWLFVLSFQQLLPLPSVNTLGSQISQEPALLSEFSSLKLNSTVGGFKARFLGHKVNCLGIEFRFHQTEVKTIYILNRVHL